MITIHTEEDFIKMRKAGKLASEILDYIGDFVKPGITTNKLNDLCHNKIIENGAIPAPLNYPVDALFGGFPKSICTSINHVVCHGIPSEKILQNGNIINIDVTVIVDGWHGDSSRMYYAGEPSIKAKRLCEATFEAMMLGIQQVKPGNSLGDIGFAIQSYVEKLGFSVVRDYCGHGIGKVFHTEPNVLHYKKKYSEYIDEYTKKMKQKYEEYLAKEKRNQNKNKPLTQEQFNELQKKSLTQEQFNERQKSSDIILEEGMFFTIEPMINAGKYETILNKHDGWTVTTRDKSLSAQFEHTVGVTKNGYEIFTISKNE